MRKLFLFPLAGTLLLALIALVPNEAEANACMQGPGQRIRSRSGARADVHPVAAERFRCVVQKLERVYSIRVMGGYGCRPIRTSKHPRGLAMDINQYARDITRPRIPRASATEIARSCGVVHGSVWRNPDAGHFEVPSYGRSAYASRGYQRSYSGRNAHRRPDRGYYGGGYGYGPSHDMFDFLSWLGL